MTSTPPENPEAPAVGGYPVHPGTPENDFAPRPKVPQPASIATAVKLMYAGAVINLVSAVSTLTSMGAMKTSVVDELRKADANVSQSTIDAAYGVAVGFALLFSVVGVLIWLWMAWKNGQGRSWARIVASVLGGINVISTVFTVLGGNSPALTTTISAINLVLAIVILTFLWRKESSAYYAAS